MPVAIWREEGAALTGYFYNPNIQPLTEWLQRRDALLTYARLVQLPLYVEEDYRPEEHLRLALTAGEERCRYCYRLRLEKTAHLAAAEGFDAFTTTLLLSPYQKHEWLREEGERAAARAGIPFIYRDLRPYFREAGNRARELALYRQKYCGCLFSERERYAKKIELLEEAKGVVVGARSQWGEMSP